MDRKDRKTNEEKVVEGTNSEKHPATKKDISAEKPQHSQSSLQESGFLVNMKNVMEGQVQEIISSAGLLVSTYEKGEMLKVKTDGIQQNVVDYQEQLKKKKGDFYERIIDNISPNKSSSSI